MSTTSTVGVVRALHRYPVKSMAGEALTEAQIGWHGVEGDRRYAFARTGQIVGFPWLTASKLPELLGYSAHYRAPADPRASAMQVATPDGRTLDLTSAALAAELSAAHGAAVHLMRLDSGIFDQLALSLISLETVAAIGAAVGRDLEMMRFRPNIVIETLDGQPFREDAWVNHLLLFGERADAAAMRVNERDVRCVMVNMDPATQVKDARVLKTIAQTRTNCLGVYGSTERAGTIRVGDLVRLQTYEA